MDTYETGNTEQFTFTTSVAPNSGSVVLKITGITGTVVASVSGVQSDTTHHYALYTIPTSAGYYLGEWFAQKTVSGSAYNFIKRFVFAVNTTQVPG